MILINRHRFPIIGILYGSIFAFIITATFVSLSSASASETTPIAVTRPEQQIPRQALPPAKLPDEIDRLCPSYPGAVLLQVEEGEDQTRAMFKSAAPPNEISDYYKKELSERGWTVFKEMRDEKSPRLILNKGNEQIGFSAIMHPSKIVTYFLSLRNI